MRDPAKILVVDDEPNVRFILQRALEKEKYLVTTAADGREALAKIERDTYDLVVLDLQMQPVDGMQVLQAVRVRDPDTVVIILTAHSTVETAVEALRLGAFDYLFKPALPDALRRRVREGLKQRHEARQRAQLLRKVDDLRATLLDANAEREPTRHNRNSGHAYTSQILTIDQKHRVARLNGSSLELTTTEFDVLSCLVHNAPKPVSPRQLVNQALGYDAEEAESAEIIKYHVHQLRKKIEGDPLHPILIKTVRYKGYLWSGE
jgi:DNA-binding response OmpR family regulator